VLLTCSYKDTEEFLRVGYYVNIEYDTPELNENPPPRPEISRLTRHILAEKPRVTKF
jgi:histone chaperone ASF1